MSETEIDHTYTDEIVCPHCGYKFTDSWELSDSDGATVACWSCDVPFVLSVDTSITYSTYKIGANGKAER